MRLQIAYSKRDERSAIEIISALSSLNYELDVTNSELLDEKAVTIVLFSTSTEENELLNELPWLKKERMRSNVKHLKVMPLFVYHSKREDPEKEFDKNVGMLYEDIFSTEFKPYGWDFDSDAPEREFPLILEQYSE